MRTPLTYLLTILFILSISTSLSAQEEEPQISIRVDDVLGDFDETWNTIAENYVDAEFEGLDWEALKTEYRPRVEGAEDAEKAYELLAEMVGKLENGNTFVVPPWLRPPPEDDSEPMLEYGGVGILLQQLESGEVMVLQVFRDTPAERAKVLVGDLIVGVNDWRVEGDNPMEDIANRVRGPVDTSVDVTFRDPEGEERALAITRAQIDLKPSVEDRMIEGTIGYLRVPVLTEDLVEYASKALPRLLSTSGLILDLRSVSAGTMDGMVQIAQWFLGAGQMGGFFMRGDAFGMPFNEEAIQAYHRPIVILTNPRTYGLAEILTRVMSDYDRASVVGNTTSGGFEIGRFVDLPSGGLLHVAIGRYITPTGEFLPLDGIVPDVEVEFPDLETIRSGRDVYIEKAVEVLRNPQRR